MKPMIIVLLISVAVFLWLGNRSGELATETTAVGAIKRTDDLEVHLTQTGMLFDTFMLFGGHVDKRLHNSISDYSVGALEIEEASLIRRDYPDFHLCKSPGASVAQRRIRSLSLIAENQDAADILEYAIELHGERLAAGEERICVELRGQQVKPTSIFLKENGMDISQDFIPSLQKLDLYLVDGVEIRDCQNLM